MEEDQENLSIATETHDEPMTDDNFTLSDGATPTQDEPETGISQMDAADIESELNNLLTIDDCHSPLPDWIADAGELALGVDMGAPQDSRKGILAINSNSN